jgi:hypothetical protein
MQGVQGSKGEVKSMNVDFACRMKVQELVMEHFFDLVIYSTTTWNNEFVEKLLALINEFNAWADTVHLAKKKEEAKEK